MTQARVAGAIPEWTLGDRLRRAREYAGLTQGELAALTGISQRSVSAYESGARVKRPQALVWAMCCGVDSEWLTGEADQGPDDPQEDDVRRQGLEPRTRWLSAA